MFSRSAADDGRHLLRLVIDEDASARAGEAQWSAACSCELMPVTPAGTRERALAAYVAHTRATLVPPPGPDWLPAGGRVALLVALMLSIWSGCYAVGRAVVHGQHLTGLTAYAVLGVSSLTGLSLAFALRAATRRYIGPTRG